MGFLKNLFRPSPVSSTDKVTPGARIVKGYAIKPRANLADADLSGANLEKVDLSCANLRKANLSRANLVSANLSGADLSYANLGEANLEGANLYRANIGMANFGGANLYRANMTDAQMFVPNFRGTIMPDGRKSISPYGDVFDEEATVPNMTSYNIHEAEAHCELGDQLMLEDRLSDAIREYKTALSLDPNHVKSRFHLSMAYGRKGLKSDEIRELQEVLRIDPEYAEAHTILGTHFLEQEQYDEALHEFEVAKSLGSMLAAGQLGNMKKLIELGWIQLEKQSSVPLLCSPHGLQALEHLKAGHFHEAIREFQTAILTEGECAEAHLNMGLAYIWLKQANEARPEFEIALKLNPNLAEAHRCMAAFYGAEGNLDKAVEELLESLRINLDNSVTHYNLAMVFMQRDPKALALPELQVAAALGNEDAKKELRHF